MLRVLTDESTGHIIEFLFWLLQSCPFPFTIGYLLSNLCMSPAVMFCSIACNSCSTSLTCKRMSVWLDRLVWCSTFHGEIPFLCCIWHSMGHMQSCSVLKFPLAPMAVECSLETGIHRLWRSIKTVDFCSFRLPSRVRESLFGRVARIFSTRNALYEYPKGRVNTIRDVQMPICL